jgi:hypothetical protein
MGKTIEGVFAADAARAAGLKRYFTGVPCKAGHIAERQISNGTCVECIKIRAKANMHWFREHDKKRQQTTKRRAEKAANERRNRKQEHRIPVQAANRMKRIADQLQRTPKWADLDEIKEIYRKAAQATKLTGFAYQVDHIIPLNGKFVSGLHVTGNLRVITKTDNLLKGSKYVV